MSPRKSRRRRAAGKAAKAMTLYKLATPVGGAVKAFKRGRADKRSAPGKRKPLALLAGLLGIAGAAAAMRKRKQPDDLGYGPPNESHPSHETLAPSRAAAGQAGDDETTTPAAAAGQAGGDEAATQAAATGQAGNGGPAREEAASEEPAATETAVSAEAAEPAGPPGDEAGSEDPGREERSESAN